MARWMRRPEADGDAEVTHVHLPPGAEIVDGRVRDTTTGQPYLTRAQLGQALGVPVGTLDTWGHTYGPASSDPFPWHRDDQHACAGGRRLVLETVAREWMGRQRERAMAAKRRNAEAARAGLAALRARRKGAA
jgi:hypothetical protein